MPGLSTILILTAGAVLLTALFYLILNAVLPVPVPGTGKKIFSRLLAPSFIAALLIIAGIYGINQRVDFLYGDYIVRQGLIESSKLMNDLLSQPKYQDTLRLTRYEAKVFSQNGEDGIIAEIFRRIGTTDRHFVEFGSADGIENNTAFLLRQGWSGLWLDGDNSAIERARTSFSREIAEKRLSADVTFITAENIEPLFASHSVPKEPDLLSIDIDRNDYHVWKAIKAYRPRVVIIEYNAIFTPRMQWVVDYRGDAWWDGTAMFGASLSALEMLGKEKGYSLVGCTMAGVNAFFVRTDLVGDKFCTPFTAQNHYEPPRYWMTWGGHPRTI